MQDEEKKEPAQTQETVTAPEQTNSAASAITDAAAASAAATKVGLTDNVLRDGRKFEVQDANGHDVIKATRMIGQDTEKLIPALVQQKTLFDGTKITLEEILDLPAGDYLKVLGAFSEKNF